MSFNGKVVIVTGSSSGIGAAIAIKFAQEGANVTIVGRNQQKLAGVAKKCGNPLVLVADVTKDEDARKIVNETVKRFGKLDILINNAGIIGTASILSEDAMAMFDKIMLTNVRSAVYITNLAAPHLIKTKGNIVNISSIAGLRVMIQHNFSYNTSKAALDHFTRCIAQELASSGIRVNSVNPGPVRTDIVSNAGTGKELEEAFFEDFKDVTALGTISQPEQVADLVLFVASDKAKSITGSTFVTDDGYLLNLNEPTNKTIQL